MIGDLTGAPQPIVVKLFSPIADLLADLGAARGGCAGQDLRQRQEARRGYRGRHREHHERAGRASSRSIRTTAAKAGFTTDQLTTVASAIVDGEPATTPVIINDRPYTLRVRFPAATRASLEAMSNTMLVNSNGGTATLGSLGHGHRIARARRKFLRDNLQREVEVTARLEGLDLGTGVAAVQKAVNDLKLPPVDSRRIRRHLSRSSRNRSTIWSSCCCWRWC